MQHIGQVLGHLPRPTVSAAAATVGSSSPEAASACPWCGGAGWVRRELPVGHPSFGTPVPCRCQEERLKGSRLERLFHMSRMGDQLRQMTFDTFLTEGIPYDDALVANPAYKQEISRNLKRALGIAQAYAAEPQSWLVLFGDYGCGKTHLAVAIANDRIARGEPALFQVVPDLLDHLRATFSPSATVTYDELFEEVRSAPLLILDDLGAHSSSSWAEEKLFQIVNHRYNHRLPTVVTTNLPPDRLDPRLVSRMTDMGSRLFKMIAPDFRGGLGAPSPSTWQGGSGRGSAGRR